MGENTINNVVIFVAGAAIGSFVTWKIVSSKYEQIIEDEIAACNEYYQNILEPTDAEKEENEADDEDVKEASVSKPDPKPDIKEVAKKESEYTDYTKLSKSEDHDEVEFDDLDEQDELENNKQLHFAPYHIITPEEFGEEDGYELINLVYYADGYLADDMDDLVEQVEEKIGWETLEEMGKFEDDALHVRNDDLKIDYEILRDLRSYYGDIKQEE